MVIMAMLFLVTENYTRSARSVCKQTLIHVMEIKIMENFLWQKNV